MGDAFNVVITARPQYRDGHIRLQDVIAESDGKSGFYIRRVCAGLSGSLARDFRYPLEAEAQKLLEEPGKRELRGFKVPEIRVSDRALVLVGVAYTIAHTGPDDPQPAGFAGNADAWHYHQDLCFLPTGSVTITPSAQPCRARGGYFQAKTAWLLHAWIWKTNPDGLFTESNPSVF